MYSIQDDMFVYQQETESACYNLNGQLQSKLNDISQKAKLLFSKLFE
jgi:hypothetical protein